MAQPVQRLTSAKSYPVRKLDELVATVREHVVDEIIFAVDADKLAELEDVLLVCDEEGIRTRVVMDIFPHIQSKVYVERFSDVPMLTFSTTPHDEIRLFLKRAFDVALGVSSLLVLALPMALLAPHDPADFQRTGHLPPSGAAASTAAVLSATSSARWWPTPRSSGETLPTSMKKTARYSKSPTTLA